MRLQGVDQRCSASNGRCHVHGLGVPHGSGYLLKIKLTHKDFADLIASTRETVTATLNKMKNDGLIEFQDKYVVIKSTGKITDLAH